MYTFDRRQIQCKYGPRRVFRHTFPYSVKVIFACLRLTTGQRNRARAGSDSATPWLDLRPTAIVRERDLWNVRVSDGCSSFSSTCNTMPSTRLSKGDTRSECRCNVPVMLDRSAPVMSIVMLDLASIVVVVVEVEIIVGKRGHCPGRRHIVVTTQVRHM